MLNNIFIYIIGLENWGLNLIVFVYFARQTQLSLHIFPYTHEHTWERGERTGSTGQLDIDAAGTVRRKSQATFFLASIIADYITLCHAASLVRISRVFTHGHSQQQQQ